MNMNFLTICGIGVLSVILCVLVRQLKPSFATMLSILAGMLMLGGILTAISPSIVVISKLSEQAGMDNEILKALFKALCVCYISSLCADFARDAGENALASKLELAGRAAIAVISLPVFTSLADFVTGMLN